MPSSLLLGQPDGGPGSSAHPGRGPYPLPFERRPLSTTLVAPTVTVTNDFEGGSNGVAITISNAGGAGNTQFDQVTATATCLANFDTTHPGHGTLGMLCQTGGTTGEAYAMWSTALTGGPFVTLYLRAYLYLTANPGTQTRLFRWLNVSTVRGSVQLTTTGKLLISDAAGTGVGTSTNSVPLNQLVRVEARCTGDAAAGVLEVKLFDSPESTTPLETVTATAQNTGGTIDRVRFGQTGTPVASVTYWLDDLGASNADYLGPVGGGGGTSVNAENAAGTGSSLDAQAAIAPNAENAAGSGAAQDPTASVGAQAENAAGTGQAFDATVSTAGGTSAPAEVASGTGAAFDPSILVSANAESVSGTGTAQDATGGIGPPAGAASGTGTAQDPLAAISANAENAAGTGQALDPAVVVGIFAQAENATGTGAALDASVSIAPAAQNATGTGTANDATVLTGTVAQAETAAGTGAALDPTITVAPNAETAAGTGAANNATVAFGKDAPAEVATGTGAALDPTVRISPTAENATGTGQALDATVVFELIVIYAIGAVTLQPATTGTATSAAASGTATLQLAASGEASTQ